MIIYLNIIEKIINGEKKTKTKIFLFSRFPFIASEIFYSEYEALLNQFFEEKPVIDIEIVEQTATDPTNQDNQEEMEKKIEVVGLKKNELIEYLLSYLQNASASLNVTSTGYFAKVMNALLNRKFIEVTKNN